MGLFKKLTGFLGLGSHNEAHDSKIEDDDNTTTNPSTTTTNNNNYTNSDDFRRNRMNADPIPTGPRRGFSVPVQVPVDRPVVGPVLVPCNGDGGVQGLRWYAARLKTDEDDDVADEFLYQLSLDTSSLPHDQPKPLPRYQVKHNTKHAKIKQQVLTSDGKLQHCVDCKGKLQWV